MRFLHLEWFCGTTIGSERSFRLSDEVAFLASRQSPAPALQGAFVPSHQRHQRHQAFLFHQSRVTSRGPFDPFDKAPCLV